MVDPLIEGFVVVELKKRHIFLIVIGTIVTIIFLIAAFIGLVFLSGWILWFCTGRNNTRARDHIPEFHVLKYEENELNNRYQNIYRYQDNEENKNVVSLSFTKENVGNYHFDIIPTFIIY